MQEYLRDDVDWGDVDDRDKAPDTGDEIIFAAPELVGGGKVTEPVLDILNEVEDEELMALMDEAQSLLMTLEPSIMEFEVLLHANREEINRGIHGEEAIRAKINDFLTISSTLTALTNPFESKRLKRSMKLPIEMQIAESKFLHGIENGDKKALLRALMHDIAQITETIRRMISDPSMGEGGGEECLQDPELAEYASWWKD